VLTTTIQQI